MGHAPLVGVLVVGNVGGEEDREARSRINREAMPRLEGQSSLVEVPRRILDHEARGAYGVHWLARPTAGQEVDAGQVALAAVLVGGDEAARLDHQRTVFAVVGVEVFGPRAEDSARAGEEMGLQGLTCVALLKYAAYTALCCVGHRPVVGGLDGGDGLVG